MQQVVTGKFPQLECLFCFDCRTACFSAPAVGAFSSRTSIIFPSHRCYFSVVEIPIPINSTEKMYVVLYLGKKFSPRCPQGIASTKATGGFHGLSASIGVTQKWKAASCHLSEQPLAIGMGEHHPTPHQMCFLCLDHHDRNGSLCRDHCEFFFEPRHTVPWRTNHKYGLTSLGGLCHVPVLQ